jgi:hypothetical protein
VPGPSRRVGRGCGEAPSSTIHARPSHQGVEHQQSAIQVSLNLARHQINHIHQIREIDQVAIELDARFAALSVHCGWRPACQ